MGEGDIWAKFGVLLGVEGFKGIGAITLNEEELKMLRLMLTREYGGVVATDDNPGLKRLLTAVTSMEQYLARKRGAGT